MGSVISFYEQLVGTEDDRERMRLIAEALERLEHRPLPDNVATSEQLRETELRLQKEIEQVRHETELIRAELKQDIEQVRAELKQDIEQVRAELKQDIEQVRAELKQDIAALHADLEKRTGELDVKIEQVRAELNVKIEQVRADLGRDIERIKADTLKWVAGLLVVQGAAVVGAITALV